MAESSPFTRALQKGVLWGLAVTASFLFAVLLAGIWQFWQLQASIDRQVALVTIVVNQRDELLQMVNEETGVRGYVATGDSHFLEIYHASVSRERNDERALKSAASSAAPAAPALQRRIENVKKYLASEIALVHSGNAVRARAQLAHGKRLFDRFRQAEAQGEQRIEREMQAQRDHTRFLARAGFVVGILVCVLLIISATAFIIVLRRTTTYRLKSVRDPLTGAHNRQGAIDAVRRLIDPRSAQPFRLVFIDLDGFKKVNDTHGHHVGDEILRDVVCRLRAELRDHDNVARLGGDEFVCVLSPPTTIEQLRHIAARLQKVLERPYHGERDVYFVGCSVGLSVYPEHGATPDALLKSADRAMYSAKGAGGGVREAVPA